MRTAPVVEEQALAALYREHATAVRAFVRAQLPDPDRTEDVVQETFLRAWRQIARMDLAGGNPRSYLFTTARNILTDSWRAQSRRPRMVDDEQQPATAPSTVKSRCHYAVRALRAAFDEMGILR